MVKPEDLATVLAQLRGEPGAKASTDVANAANRIDNGTMAAGEFEEFIPKGNPDEDEEDANKRVAVDDEPASIEMTLESTLRVLSSVRKGSESNLMPSFPLDE